MIAMHGNVTGRQALPHRAFSRFVAILDVLGMKEWLKKDSAGAIAESLDVALVACEQSSCGSTGAGVSYGPLVDVIHFSDALIAWTPDDSWASLGVLCSSIKMIVGVALTNGVPLRGAIAHGEAVCNPRTLKFVGKPIAEAYLWAERQRLFKSAGVDLTPPTIAKLVSLLANEPMPDHWKSYLSASVLRRETEAAEDLMWHADCLFVNHWHHGMFLRSDPTAMFLKRNLPVAADQRAAVDAKLRELQEFYENHQLVQSRTSRNRPEVTDAPSRVKDFQLRQDDYVALDRLRKVRAEL
jgi:hypothetical protein